MSQVFSEYAECSVKRPDDYPLKELDNVIQADAVVIGGGPNGLITAAYLAKAGAKVVLCEKRYEVGGGLATEEVMFPCFFANTHATYHMMVDYMPPIRDFQMEELGLRWIRPKRAGGACAQGWERPSALPHARRQLRLDPEVLKGRRCRVWEGSPRVSSDGRRIPGACDLLAACSPC